MKKFLSLVLALVMTMSLVTVSAGATDFEDDGDITYQEAVTVIAGLGIVDGYSDGTFGPDEALTRGAAAKIICNLILGPTTADALSASSAPFVDVPTTNTFAGYITYCAQQGIISGYADGTFRPSGTLSGNAFMKMLLGALGYDSDREGYTGANWTVNVIKQAVGIGLDDGNDDFAGSNAVTREEACLYAFNTLQATMVEYENSSTITVGDITITGQGDYSDVTNGTSSEGNIEDDGLMQFAERYFRDLTAEDGTDDFGRPATNWVYDGDDLGTYANDADESCVVDDASVALSDLLTDNSYLGYSSSDILDDAVIYFNGQEVDSNDSIYEDNADETSLAGKGDIIEAFENDDGDVETIVIRSYTYAMIDEADEDLSSSVQSDGASVGLELVDIDGDSLGNGTYYDDHDDDEKVLNGWDAGYDAGTAIAVALGEDDAILDSYVMETVTGTPTSARAVDVDDYTYDFAMSNYYSGGAVKTGNITIDGTRYTYAAQFTGLEDGADVDFDSEYVVCLTADVNASSSVIRINDGNYYDGSDDENNDTTGGQSVMTRLYLADSTFFIGAEGEGDNLDVSTATAVMSVDYSNSKNLIVAAIFDDDDAAFVVYAADELSGATDKADVVYLAGSANTRASSSTYYGDLYFMDDMSLQEEVYISDDGETTQGFYVYDLSDDVYELSDDAEELGNFSSGKVTDDSDGYAEYVVFYEGRNSTVTSQTSGSYFELAADEEDEDDLYTDGAFDTTSISGAEVIDTRDDDDADDDAYSQTINSPSRLIAALDRGWVVADVYVEDGDIIFVAVRSCMDDGVTVDEDDETGGETEIPDTDAVVLDADEISDSEDMTLTEDDVSIAYYRESGADLANTNANKIALLAAAGATDISVSSGSFTYTYNGNEFTVSGSDITLVRYYEIEVDGETHYLKEGDTVKRSNGTVSGLTGTYYGINGAYPTSTSMTCNSGYTVDSYADGQRDMSIESGYYAVSTTAFASATGSGTDVGLFSVTGVESNTFVKAGDTLTVQLELSGTATVDSTVTISGAGIDTETIRVDEDETGPITVTLDIANDISSSISSGSISVAVENR